MTDNNGNNTKAPRAEFTMEKGRIVAPLSGDWFRTVSFGDAIKIMIFVGSAIFAFANLKADLGHETEMRQMLEARTQETLTEVRQAQKDNSTRTDSRFIETQQRDRELLAEIKSRMDRLETKVDQLLSNRAGR